MNEQAKSTASTMKLPGFGAEASLYGKISHYHASMIAQQTGEAIYPAQSFRLCGNKFAGQTRSCPAGETCMPRRSRVCDGWWIFRRCDYIQTIDWFCQ